MGYLIRIALGAAAASLWLHGATAQTAVTKDDAWTIPNRERVNEGAVTIITAPAGGATSVFGSDMARVLDEDQNSSSRSSCPWEGAGPQRRRYPLSQGDRHGCRYGRRS